MLVSNIFNHLNLIGINRAPHPTTIEYTLFLRAHRTFNKLGLPIY